MTESSTAGDAFHPQDTEKSELQARIAALEQESAQLRAILHSAPANIYMKDENGVYRFINRRVMELFHLDPETSEGLTDRDFFPGSCTQTDQLRANDKTVLQSGVAREVEEVVPHPDGTLHTYLSLKFPLVSADGQSTALVGISTDITERVAVEAALRAAQERQAFLAQASLLLASSLDYATTLQSVTRLAVPFLADWCVIGLKDDAGELGFVAAAHRDPTKEAVLDDLSRRYWREFSHPHHLIGRVLRTGLTEAHPVVLEATNPAIYDPEHLRMLGILGMTAVMVVPLIARQQVIGVLFCVASTPGKQYSTDDCSTAEELALRASQAIDNARLYRQVQTALAVQKTVDETKDRFVSMAAHELRTPLTTIKAFTQLLERRLTPSDTEGRGADERIMRTLQNLDTQVSRMARLIDDMLDVSRIHTGQLRFHYSKDVDVAALVQQIAVQLQGNEIDHMLRVEAPQSFTATVDTARIEQVLTNMISNACKYSAPGTAVVVGVVRHGVDEVLVWVRDQGIGIAPDDQAAIFNQFYRVRGDAQQSPMGLGLGLYICHEIVTRHGGRIWVESTPGVGSTFYFTLPHQPPEVEAATDA